VSPSAELLWQPLDAQRQLKRDAEKQLIAESHRLPIASRQAASAMSQKWSVENEHNRSCP
jgi:hypothetical protein